MGRNTFDNTVSDMHTIVTDVKQRMMCTSIARRNNPALKRHGHLVIPAQLGIAEPAIIGATTAITPMGHKVFLCRADGGPVGGLRGYGGTSGEEKQARNKKQHFHIAPPHEIDRESIADLRGKVKAIVEEKPRRNERAITVEKPICAERATCNEKPMFPERATGDEKPKKQERA